MVPAESVKKLQKLRSKTILSVKLIFEDLGERLTATQKGRYRILR